VDKFKRADEFVCPGCGEPQSQLPVDHDLYLDDSGATVCGSGVRPMEFRVEIWRSSDG